jgi:hypothetical protein
MKIRYNRSSQSEVDYQILSEVIRLLGDRRSARVTTATLRELRDDDFPYATNPRSHRSPVKASASSAPAPEHLGAQ